MHGCHSKHVWGMMLTQSVTRVGRHIETAHEWVIRDRQSRGLTSTPDVRPRDMVRRKGMKRERDGDKCFPGHVLRVIEPDGDHLFWRLVVKWEVPDAATGLDVSTVNAEFVIVYRAINDRVG